MSDPWEVDLVYDLRNPPVMSMFGSRDAIYAIMAVRMWKAADELDRLQAENERLREALERVDRCATYPVCTTINPRGYDVRPPNKELVELIAEIVRAALQDKGDE